MSNRLAIATVTAALRRQVQDAAQITVPAATVRLGPPIARLAEQTKPVVNLFLYLVRPNPNLRNANMPSRRADGGERARSRITLDLYYVLSFYGDASTMEPERMMGAVALELEDRPILSRSAVAAAIAANPDVLADSDLDEALSTVRISQEAMTLDELSRMWAIFFQTPYGLSAAYQLSHLVIEPDADVPPALPVASPRIWTAPIVGFGLDDVVSAEHPAAPIRWGDTVRLRGRGLSRDGVGVRIGAQDVVLEEGEATDREIRLALTEPRLGAELPAGFHHVQAMAPTGGGAPAHLARTTEARVFALRPAIENVEVTLGAGTTPEAAEGDIRITFSPQVVEDQSVRLTLAERVADVPQTIVLGAEAPDGGFPASELAFAFAGLNRSTFLVIVQVDGVGSAPDIDHDIESPTFGEILGPTADLT